MYADVLQLANGRSKGCGIVEYSTPEEAQKAVETLSNQELMGRLVYVREDRESELKVVSGGGPTRGGGPGGTSFNGPPPAAGAQLFVSNLPYSVGWQDLKDLFRNAGTVVRADVQQTSDGRSKGSGIVSFETAEDAQIAIDKYNGYEWLGRQIEVREDKFAGAPPRSGFGSGARGESFRGGFRGGRGGGYSSYNKEPRAPNDFTDGATGNGDPSETIYVGNLPWSTTNQDLVDLFQTVGEVDRAEIQLLPNGRSQGAGVVRFSNPATAEIAISKFNGYNYGNRDLALSFVSYSAAA